MKTLAFLAVAFTACGLAGDTVTKPNERLELVSTLPVLNASGGRGILVSASLVRDRETGRGWLIVSGTAGTNVHVTEIQK
jgi:hypothetical protein